MACKNDLIVGCQTETVRQGRLYKFSEEQNDKRLPAGRQGAQQKFHQGDKAGKILLRKLWPRYTLQTIQDK